MMWRPLHYFGRAFIRIAAECKLMGAMDGFLFTFIPDGVMMRMTNGVVTYEAIHY
jgi:hypothetical protein